MDQILCAITAGGLLLRQEPGTTFLSAKQAGVLTIGPNPTRGAFVFPGASALGVGATTASVCDLGGRLVATIRADSGRPLVWNGRGKGGSPVAPGIYLYRVTGGARIVSGKIVVVH